MCAQWFRAFELPDAVVPKLAHKHMCSQPFAIEVKFRHFFGNLLLRANFLAAGSQIFDGLQTKIH
jgi:hypothetical protein